MTTLRTPWLATPLLALRLSTGLMMGITGLVFYTTGCAGVSARPTSRAPSTLVIDATPSKPKIFIDGEYMGTLDRWRDRMLPLIAGEHRLELRAEGYYPHREDLNLEAGRTYTLRVVMVRRYD